MPNIWITTPSRTASRYLAGMITDNYKVDRLEVTHSPGLLPMDPAQWHLVINQRRDHHAATLSNIIQGMSRPRSIPVMEYLNTLGWHHGYERLLAPAPWLTRTRLTMEDFTLEPESVAHLVPHWPRRRLDTWVLPDTPRFRSNRAHEQWCLNHAQLLEIGKAVERDGHWLGLQVIQDPMDPRFSRDRTPQWNALLADSPPATDPAHPRGHPRSH